MQTSLTHYAPTTPAGGGRDGIGPSYHYWTVRASVKFGRGQDGQFSPPGPPPRLAGHVRTATLPGMSGQPDAHPSPQCVHTMRLTALSIQSNRPQAKGRHLGARIRRGSAVRI